MKIEHKKDMYADLEKIEKRGKKKKKGFSLFGKKEEDDNDSGKEEVEQLADLKPARDEPEERPEPETQPSPPSEPKQSPPSQPAPAESPPEPGWQPLTGKKLEAAEAQLKAYKKKLNKAFLAKKLTKDQCLAKARQKEIELGLKPPK